MRRRLAPLAALLLLAACGGGGGSARRSAPADSTAADAALEASSRGDVDAAEALLRDAHDPDSLRLRARFLLMKNRNKEAVDLLAPLASEKVKDMAEVERRQGVLPDLLLAYVRLDDFMNAARIARLSGDVPLARKYESLSRGVAYSSNLGADEITVEFFVTDPVPIVAGTVGGLRALFVVDTLLDEVVLDRDFARRAGVLPVAGGADEAVLPELSIGRLTVRNVPIHLGRSMEVGALRPEGAVGLQFLMHYDFTLDYRRSRLVFRHAGGTVPGQPALLAGDRYLLLKGLMNGTDRTFVGVGSSLKGVTVAASELYTDPSGSRVTEISAGPFKLVKPPLDSKAFPAGLDGSFGVPIPFVLGHAALRGHVLRLEPRSMTLALD
jgi:hypothetical protein